MGSPRTIGTNHPTQITSQCWGSLANNKGFFTDAFFDGDNSMTLPTTTSQFANGCRLTNSGHTSASSTTTTWWVNTGGPTTPSWTVITIS